MCVCVCFIVYSTVRISLSLSLSSVIIYSVLLLHTHTQVEEGKKAPKLQDLVRLHEIIIQNFKELLNLPGLEDDLELRKSVEGQVTAHKAHR